jgi:hypothetical protein
VMQRWTRPGRVLGNPASVNSSTAVCNRSIATRPSFCTDVGLEARSQGASYLKGRCSNESVGWLLAIVPATKTPASDVESARPPCIKHYRMGVGGAPGWQYCAEHERAPHRC